MKIQFLGTAAFEGVPSLFCNCRVCRTSQRLGGRNIRSRSQALVDECILLDFNADTVAHYQKYAFDWDKIRVCLITHSHSDHLYPKDIAMNGPGYADCHMALDIRAPESGYALLESVAQGTPYVKIQKIAPGDSFWVGDYHIWVLRADHDPAATPVLYAIEREGKRLLYAHDTGLFPNETWAQLEKIGKFDMVSLDCTGCDRSDGWLSNHLSLPGDLAVLEKMKHLGIADAQTHVVLNHFSHNGGKTYDEMAELVDTLGLTVSYDGLIVEF